MLLSSCNLYIIKKEEKNMGWIILAIVVILVIAVISMYNDLVSRRVKVDNAWSQIDVQLQVMNQKHLKK